MQSSAITVSTVCSRLSLVMMLILLVAPLSGCRICNNTEDLAYPSYGGAWERTIRDSGRVGSLFDPAGAKTSTLNPKDAAVTQDELERGRRAEEDAAEPSAPTDDPTEEALPEDDDSGDEPKFGEDEVDEDLKKRMDKLRDQDLDDVKIIPGDALPPLLR
jgi:hypothetical protein